MIPKLNRVSQHTFDRIGDQYGPYIDREHFLGRSPCDGLWEKNHSAPVMVNHEEDRSVIQVNLKGFKKEDIHIHFKNDELYLRACAEESKKTGGITKVNRSFSIPTGTDRKSITAQFEEGIVKIVLPRAILEEEGDIAIV